MSQKNDPQLNQDEFFDLLLKQVDDSSIKKIMELIRKYPSGRDTEKVLDEIIKIEK